MKHFAIFTFIFTLVKICFSNQPHITLPDKIIAGYFSYRNCNYSVVEAAKNGVNVIIWFSIDLYIDENLKAKIKTRSGDMECIRTTVKELNKLGLNDTVHLISIGGWNEAHPDTRSTAEEYYEAWLRWNKNSVASEELGFKGFAGIDWDTEGHDDFESPRNYFTMECLNLMGKLSQLFKKDGYIVSMAPAESYTDPITKEFSRYVNLSYPEWDKEVPYFKYHGKNIYSYLLVKYGETVLDCLSSHKINQGVTIESNCKKNSNYLSNNIPSVIPTFDFVSVQLYETYSHTLYNLTRLNVRFKDYLQNLVNKLTFGWEVDFSSDPTTGLGLEKVKINKNQLVIGLANGWAGGKFLFLKGEEIEEAYKNLSQKSINLEIRGFMFWNIESEGIIPEGERQPFWMAKVLNNILHTRKVN